MENQYSPEDVDAVRAHLDRVLRAEKFEASERNHHFLKYVVEETLAGRRAGSRPAALRRLRWGGARISIRRSTPIVRIEAHRLRRTLAYYYMTDGEGDQLRIDIPKGSYVPRIEKVDLNGMGPSPPIEKPHLPQSAPGSDSPPTILVTPFEAEFDQAAYPNLTRDRRVRA